MKKKMTVDRFMNLLHNLSSISENIAKARYDNSISVKDYDILFGKYLDEKDKIIDTLFDACSDILTIKGVLK